jgi:cyclophilin family peptidyl-prolyl cis-trans isomerase
MSRFLGAGLVVLVGLAAAAQAQQLPDDATGDAKARFQAAMTEYKNAIREIETQRNNYQSADNAAREQINGQLAELVDRAQSSLERMVETGLEAYRAAPGDNKEIAELLVAVASHRVVGRVLDPSGKLRDGGDQYETALPIIRALIDGGSGHSILPVWGFVCAFMVNDYDQAEEFATMAKENGAFVDPSTLSNQAEKELMGLALQSAGTMEIYRGLWAEEQAIRAAEAQADDLPRVKLSTTEGDIVIELFENEAPIAVANFITLVKQGYYDGLTFHRVLPAFMAQGGCPDGTGSGGPGYNIRCECYEPNYRKHFRGSMSMAHVGRRDTGGSQFFLTFVPTAHLDGKHTVFGRVLEGFEVIGKLQKRSPSGNPSADAQLPAPDQIVKAEVLRDRGHAYDFEKLPER